MSRLYAWIESDTRKTTVTTRANERLQIRINYGSRDNSKPLLDIIVRYPKGSDRPKFQIVDLITTE